MVGTATAPGQVTPGNLASGAEFGAGLGEIVPKIVGLGRGLLSRLTRAKIGQTAEELNPEVMQGTRQPLQTPFMRGLAQVQGSAPLSGDRSFKQTLFDRVQNLDSDLKSGARAGDANSGQQAYDDYSKAYEKAKENTKSLYGQYADAVDQKDVPFMDNGYANSLKNELDGLNQAVGKKPVMETLLKPRFDIVNSFLNDRPKTFGDAVTNEQNLNELWRDNVNPASTDTRNLINRVKGSLQDSMDTTAAQHPDLNDLYQKAKQARIDQGQFEKNIEGNPTAFIKQYKNPLADSSLAPRNFMSNMVRTTKDGEDSAPFSKHFTDNLPQETKQSVFNSLMQPDDKITLAQQLNKIGKYGDGTITQLIGTKGHLLNQMKQLKSINPEAMSPEFIAKTGYTGAKMLAAMGAGGYGWHDPMAALGMAGMAVGNRGLNHLLRSEAFKNAAIRSLARRGTQNALSKYAPRFTGAITGSTGDNNGR
jgi:hypothetical protein